MVDVRPNRLAQSIRNALRFSLVPLSLCMAHSALAADEQQASNEVETIVVTASASALKVDTPMAETAQSVDIIDREKLDMHNVQKLDETFRYTAGYTSPYGADNDAEWMFVRGFEPSVYLDGNRLYKEGFFAWTVEPYGLERVELVKGASSVLYGDSMPGGLINAVQKKPTDVPQGNVTFSAGNKDYLQFGVDVSGWANEDGSQRYRMVAMVDQKDGELDGTERKRVYLAPSYTIDFSDATTLTVLASYLKDDGVPQNGFFPLVGTRYALPNGEYLDRSTNYGEPNDDDFDKTQFSLGYQLSHQLNDTWTLKQNANYAYTDLYLRSSSAYSFNSADPYTLTRYTLINDGDVNSVTFDTNATAEWETAQFENRFLAGVDVQQHVNQFKGNGTGSSVGTVNALNPTYGNVPDLSSDLYDNKITKKQVGAYSQFHTKWRQSWLANVGARYDWFDVENKGENKDAIDDGQFTWNSSLMYLASNGMSPYISYSESFYVMSSLDYITDKLYKPVESDQYEVGMKYTPSWMNGYLNLAWFNLEQKNATSTAVGSNGALTSSQTDKVETQGVEIEGQIQATEHLKLTANYTYLDARTGANDVRKSMVPHHLASGWAHYNLAGFGVEGLTIGSGVRYTGTSVDNTVSGMKVPAYLVWDAMASYAINKQWNLQVNVNNLTDDDSVAGCDYGTCYYTESRRVSATVNYNW